MKNLINPILVSLAATLLVACGDEDKSSANYEHEKASSKQELFCNVISNSRDTYLEEKEKDFYIDQEAKIQRIYDQRTLKLKELLSDGSVSNWNGEIKDILVSKGKGAFLEVGIGCDTTLEPNDSLIISIDSELYQKLRNYSENSKMKFSGTFITPKAADKNGEYPHKPFYGEKSFGQNGSMREPEFLFRFSEFHN